MKSEAVFDEGPVFSIMAVAGVVAASLPTMTRNGACCLGRQCNCGGIPLYRVGALVCRGSDRRFRGQGCQSSVPFPTGECRLYGDVLRLETDDGFRELDRELKIHRSGSLAGNLKTSL